MGPLTALLLATPIFGLSLTAPALDALPISAAPIAQLELSEEGELDGELDSDADERSDSEATDTNPDSERDDAERAKPAPAQDKATYLKQLRKRARLAKIHRTLGITTWVLTGVASIAGTIQWRNMYKGDLGTNPCVTGDAWLGERQCYGTPWFHALTGFAAGAAYFTTLGFAIAMPDPDNASEGKSKYAKTLRTHKILRWVHLTGMVAQMVLGIVIANPKISGLDRTNDYDKQKTLSIVHLTSGWVTTAALSWAGTIMLL
jgi:hypothetical protein